MGAVQYAEVIKIIAKIMRMVLSRFDWILNSL